jgi:large subunit ribosomal protein L25
VADFTIDAQVREVTGKKVSQVRNQGLVPVTVYGPKTQPVSLQIPYRALEVTLMKAGGTNLIDIMVDGKTHTVVTREVQRDVLKGTIMHVDFFAVDPEAKIRADVPVHLVGESPAVVNRRGILVSGANAITIEVLPSKLVHVIEVDLTKLQEVGDSVYVSDLDLGPDVTIINEPEEVLARIQQTSAARSEELAEMDEELAGEHTSAEPEVIGRGREDEDDED